MFEEYESDARRPWLERWFAPDTSGDSYLIARWIWLRALGAIFFSAFYSLAFQVHGLIGSHGILPVREYLPSVRGAVGIKGYWLAPTLLWLTDSDAMLTALLVIGLLASIAILINIAPRISIAVAGIVFLSFVAGLQEFSAYQSDGMLLEAALLSLFFAPPGFRPSLGTKHPPSRAAHFMLLWEWFRIYFESGVVKILSGEEQWRNFTAMDKYYENGPLPAWPGWYVEQWPHSFHAASAAATLVMELLVVWLMFFPKRSRVAAFFITTPLQIGIILTANYAFLNYLVLALGFLLLDDRFFRRTFEPPAERRPSRLAAFVLTTLLLTTSIEFLIPSFPIAIWLEPFRVANTYGLFAVMTRGRYEIEFQGTADGKTWIAYPFRYKPQDVMRRPPLFAPYQPRFDWNLWFASLGPWESNQWVILTERRLLANEPSVLSLFAGNPFTRKPPIAVRTVLWQYWFTTKEERQRTGAWWKRELVSDYAPPQP